MPFLEMVIADRSEEECQVAHDSEFFEIKDIGIDKLKEIVDNMAIGGDAEMAGPVDGPPHPVFEIEVEEEVEEDAAHTGMGFEG